MREAGRRARRIAHLLKEELGRFLIPEFQGSPGGLITVTQVELSEDLQNARVFLSVFGRNPEEVLALLDKRKGYIRKILASRVRLKYNPQLNFELDPGPEVEARIDEILESTKRHDS